MDLEAQLDDRVGFAATLLQIRKEANIAVFESVCDLRPSQAGLAHPPLGNEKLVCPLIQSLDEEPHFRLSVPERGSRDHLASAHLEPAMSHFPVLSQPCIYANETVPNDYVGNISVGIIVMGMRRVRRFVENWGIVAENRSKTGTDRDSFY